MIGSLEKTHEKRILPGLHLAAQVDSSKDDFVFEDIGIVVDVVETYDFINN